MSEIHAAIDNLYNTFSQYTAVGMQHCDCGCILETDVRKLSSKSLRELEEDDLVSYHASAIYTWGELEHYKHFLPRICELMSHNRSSGFVSPDDLFRRLEFADWRNWSESEYRAIVLYITADWKDLVNCRISEIEMNTLRTYSAFLDPETILCNWNIFENHVALRNFVDFFYVHGSQIIEGKSRLSGEDDMPLFRKSLIRKELTAHLEAMFFSNEHNDPDYAQRISIVLQMIEGSIHTERDILS